MLHKARICAPLSIIIILGLLSNLVSANQVIKAHDFSAIGANGKPVNLSDFKGETVVLHITNIEIPLCKECEKSLKSQIQELIKLHNEDPSIQIITLNLRKNPYSTNGKILAERWWKVNITWPWIEDFEPYRIGSDYVDYWTINGGFSNPTLLLIDTKGNIAGVYHIYRVGEGEIDGVQSAEILLGKIKEMHGMNWTSSEAILRQRQNISALGMFFLGIVTSLAPCSIALMIAVFSYVMTSRRRREFGLDPIMSPPKEGLIMGIAFTLGMGIVFFFIGLFISQMGIFIRDSSLFDFVAGMIMILLGISIFRPLEEILAPIISMFLEGVHEPNSSTSRETSLQKAVNFSIGLYRHSAFIGAFVLGIFFALGWAPCAVSMVFPVLIWLASQQVAPITGGLMLFIFGLGHGVPIIPIAVFSRAIGGKIGDKYISMGWWTTRIFGLLVIFMGFVYIARYFGFLLW